MRKLSLLLALALVVCTASAFADVINQRAAYNNGTFHTDLTGLNTGGWNSSTGLGTVTYSTSTSGFFDIFFDLQVMGSVPPPVGVYWNNYGTVNGTQPAGISYEIACDVVNSTCNDQLGPDIYNAVVTNALDNTNHIPGATDNYFLTCSGANCNDDVAVALGFAYTLNPGEVAAISINITKTAPRGGFYLGQFKPQDPDGAADAVYFVPSIDIYTPGTGVPEPATLALLGSGLVGVFVRRRLSKK